MLLVMMLGLLFLAAAAYFLGHAVTAPAREGPNSTRRAGPGARATELDAPRGAVRHLPARARARAAAVQGARARPGRRPAGEVDAVAATRDHDRRGARAAGGRPA